MYCKAVDGHGEGLILLQQGPLLEHLQHLPLHLLAVHCVLCLDSQQRQQGEHGWDGHCHNSHSSLQAKLCVKIASVYQ